jgi:hypothetical protein
MAQKKARNLLVVVGDLLNQGEELAHQREQQTRLGTGRDGISYQLRLMQQIDNQLGSLSWMRMMRFAQERGDLFYRSGHSGLWGWIGLQEDQRRALVQFGEQGERNRIVHFQAGRQLVDQARLTLDQAILIARQQFEFAHDGAIGLQLAQVRQITAAGLGQQIGIHHVGFDSAALRRRSTVLGLTG